MQGKKVINLPCVLMYYKLYQSKVLGKLYTPYDTSNDIVPSAPVAIGFL